MFVYQDPSMMTYLGGPMSVEAGKARFQKWLKLWETESLGPCLIQNKTTKEVVGSVVLFYTDLDGEKVFEIGWWVFPKFWRQGVAFEAANALADHAVQKLSAKVITAFPSENNTASNRICEKLGMKRIRLVPYAYGDGILSSVYWRRDV